MGPDFSAAGVFIEKGKFEDKHVGRMPCEFEGRDWGDASPSQGMPEIISNPPEAGRETWNRFSHAALRRSQPC